MAYLIVSTSGHPLDMRTVESVLRGIVERNHGTFNSPPIEEQDEEMLVPLETMSFPTLNLRDVEEGVAEAIGVHPDDVEVDFSPAETLAELHSA